MTDIVIPNLQMSSDDNEDVAFKVLNQDDLPMISVKGETIFKPFGNDPKVKPNLIVHPTRRIISNLEENKQKAKSQGNISGKSLKKKLSNSHGQLNHTNSNVGIKIEDLKSQIDTKFTRTLDAKLRRLQREEKLIVKKSVLAHNPRKPFVTTVPKGTFLEPPRNSVEKSVKKEEPRKLFTYASQPRVLNRTPAKFGHVQRCAAALAAAKIVGGVAGIPGFRDGVLEEANYGNVMHDKRVYRGSNFAQQHLGDGESSAARAAEARRRALARRKAKNQHYKSSQLRLGSPPPVAGRRHENIQTETYLEELFVNPPVSDVCTQTDLFVERPVSPFYVPAKTGADVETQIYPGDLFDFDMEVQPILEVLVGKTVEQALIEVLEEEELAALREQQRRFLELRATETAEALRLEEREKRLVKEKERRIAEHQEGVKVQKEMEERIAAAVLMQGYMADLLPSVIEGLESEGFMMDNIKEDIDESFMPWLIKEVTHELQDMVCSRDVLADIVREILENRAEIYKALNKESDVSQEEEEEGPSIEDMMLQDHLRLQREILKTRERQGSKEPTESNKEVQ
ncbi:radial spoke head protein 3 homolog [Anthonomus grandis grandis]|uniref:radial spoke head protein 3 homolog n=1 Tax=Anthonomus grandis grandis TaxID=2921223 RepID=UPI002164F268|nr:radial spoke head protein 3 homolog [Anthonomus grandis grandis]